MDSPQVAEALLVDEKTVRTWFEKYQLGGEEKLLTLWYQGKSPLLDETQQAELTKHLDENTYRTSKEIRHQRITNYELLYHNS